MDEIFGRPLAGIARAVLLAIVIVPFVAIGIAYWVSASEYVTDRSVTLDQPVPLIEMLFADINMPGLSGVELAERARDFRPELRILLLSGG